ncbi:MAG: recombination mediator RecR [Phycisphaeraceae bacterium]
MSSNSAYDNLLDELEKLPGIGRRSAERIAFHLLRRPADDAVALGHVLTRFRTNLKVCSICGHVTETDPCPICADPKRDAATLLVVEQPSDIVAIEQAGAYRGRYHVLMGRLSPMEAMGVGELNIAGLLERIKTPRQDKSDSNDTIAEVILGTNPTLEGDGTALFIAEEAKKRNVKTTRLARGLPTGSQLEFANKAVLADAIQGRQKID